MIAVIVTVLSVTIGTIGAVGLVRHEFKGKNVFNNGLYIPIIIPEVVLAVAMLAIFFSGGNSPGNTCDYYRTRYPDPSLCGN